MLTKLSTDERLAKSDDGWFIELKPGSENCNIWYNGEKLKGVSKISIEMDASMKVPKIILELSESKIGGLGISVESPEAVVLKNKTML